MNEFTYSEVRQQLAALLEQAGRDGAVRIRRGDGRVFVLRPEPSNGSPLDVPGLKLDVSGDENVDLVHAGRRPAQAPPDSALQLTSEKYRLATHAVIAPLAAEMRALVRPQRIGEMENDMRSNHQVRAGSVGIVRVTVGFHSHGSRIC